MKLFRRRTTPQDNTGAMTLAQAKVGSSVRISEIKEGACERLRSMGFCESVVVKKLTNGRNMLCTVCGTKMALSSQLAEQIIVSPA